LEALKENLVVQGHISHKREKLEEQPPVEVEEPVPLRFKEESQEGVLKELLSGNFSINKNVFDLTGTFDERFARKNEFGYEDTDLAQRIFFSSIKIYFEKNGKIRYEKRKKGDLLVL